jgi:hypothetical protein
MVFDAILGSIMVIRNRTLVLFGYTSLLPPKLLPSVMSGYLNYVNEESVVLLNSVFRVGSMFIYPSTLVKYSIFGN